MLLDNVADALKSQGLYPSRNWLDCCVSHLQQLGVTNANEILSHVYQELLDTDWLTIGGGGIPPGIRDMIRGELTEPLVVQVETITDISESVLDATERRLIGSLRDRDKRCLKLQCTDGARVLDCMEYRYCPSLDCLKVGMKLQMKNVNVRNGLVLLKESNIAVLGGEVRAKVLAEEKEFRLRCLKLKGKPYLIPKDDAADGAVDAALANEFQSNVQQGQNHDASLVHHHQPQMPQPLAMNAPQQHNGPQQIPQQPPRVQPLPPPFGGSDARLTGLPPANPSAPILSTAMLPNTPVSSMPGSGPGTHPFSGGSMLNTRPMPSTSHRADKRVMPNPTQSTTSSASHPTAPVPKVQKMAHQSAAPATVSSSPRAPGVGAVNLRRPFVYLQQCSGQGPGMYTVKAAVTSVVPPLEFKGGKYRLQVVIQDGSANVLCQVCDKIMQDIIGMPATDFEVLSNTDGERFQRLAMATANRLASLSCQMVLHYTAQEAPRIVRISEMIGSEDIALLANRVSALLHSSNG